PQNHFSTIQFPMNLLERGGIIQKNQREQTLTLLELAAESQLGVLINRPLNAIIEQGLIRLSENPPPKETTILVPNQSQKLNQTLLSLESQLKSLPLLSQKALHLLASLESVSCVLLGMRQISYVQEFIKLKKTPFFAKVDTFWNSLEEKYLLEEVLGL
ncbi:MAG: hypothetical protein AABZ60_00830, partial [Planctomycetota bacterium]